MLQRFVLEAVESLATPEVSQRIIEDALNAGGYSDIPHQPKQLSAFVEVNLHTALSETLGEEAAELVRSRLAPMIRRHTDPSEISYVRVRKNSSSDVEAAKPSSPAKNLPSQLPMKAEQPPESGKRRTLHPEESPLPTVLIAAELSDRSEALEKELADRAVVTYVEDVMAFIDQLRGEHVGAPLVVVDCDNPSVQPTTVATLAPDFPQGTMIVLWGADETLEEDVERMAQGRGRFIRCASSAGADDVAMLAFSLLGA